MSWRVVDASGLEGSIGYRRGKLHVQPLDKEPASVPLAEIQMVVTGTKASVSGAALLKLGDLGIPLTVVDWRFIPMSTSFGWAKHSRVGARQQAQAALSLPRKKSAWASLIKNKIRNQALVLQHLNKETEGRSLLEISRNVRSGDPDNREGQAARFYWRNIGFSPSFVRDQLASDAHNCALNYGYTILRGAVVRAIVEAGLWPSQGVFHHGRSNAFSLADDLIEPFRPVVDWAVFQSEEDFSIEDPEVRTRLAGCLQQQFEVSGKSVGSSIAELARSFGMYVEGDTKTLCVPTWIGPSS